MVKHETDYSSSSIRAHDNDPKATLPLEAGVICLDSGEARLRELGYKQELSREWGLMASFSGSLGLMVFLSGIAGGAFCQPGDGLAKTWDKGKQSINCPRPSDLLGQLQDTFAWGPLHVVWTVASVLSSDLSSVTMLVQAHSQLLMKTAARQWPCGAGSV